MTHQIHEEWVRREFAFRDFHEHITEISKALSRCRERRYRKLVGFIGAHRRHVDKLLSPIGKLDPLSRSPPLRSVGKRGPSNIRTARCGTGGEGVSRCVKQDLEALPGLEPRSPPGS